MTLRLRIVAFVQPGTVSRRIFVDMLESCVAAGHEVHVLDLAPVWNHLSEPAPDRADRLAGFTRHVRTLLEQVRPDLTVAMWGNMLNLLMHRMGPDRAVRTIFDDLGIPHVCLWLDAPHWAQGGSVRHLIDSSIYASPTLVHLVNNHATATEMRDVLGFGRVESLPYGVTPRGRPAADPDFDVVVSLGYGDPAPSAIALEQLERDDPDMLAIREHAAASVERRLRHLLAASPLGESPSGVARLVESQLRHRATPVLGRVLESIPSLTFHRRLYIEATMLLREIESHERAFTVSWLSRRCRVAVFGRHELDAWSMQAIDLGEVPYESMGDTYGRGRVALNVMRWQDDHGINLKTFEIAAAGVPCLMQRRAGVEHCFAAGVEIELFDGPRDAAALVDSLLRDDARRQGLGACGQARTLGHHRWTTRIAQLASMLPEGGGAVTLSRANVPAAA